MTLTFGSLFSGVGGFDLGFERSGLRCAWQVEIDAACQSVLSRHWPDVPRFADVRGVGKHNLPAVDVICGGFPCQDLSVAGKRAGLAGDRSALFYEMTRVADELRPRLLVFENVPGLLTSDGGRDFARVLLELGRVGFHGAWTGLDAQHFGLAQRRRRLFGVFARGDIGAECCAEILALRQRRKGHPPAGGEAQPGTAPSVTPGFRRASGNRAGEGIVAGTLGAENCRHPAGLKNEADLLALARCQTPGEGNRNDGDSDTFIAFNIIGLAQQGGNHAYESNVSGCLQHKGLCPTGNEAGTVIAFQERGREGGPCLEAQADVAYSLNAPAGGGRRQENNVMAGMAVRRLTPTECERLQGFPDQWTALGADGRPLSDGARYRLLGNAVAVAVAAWIGRQIIRFA